MRARLGLASALTLLMAAGSCAAAEASTAGGPWTPRWFVELDGAPEADGASTAAVAAEHRRFAAAAQAAGISYTERYAYRTLFNGVSIAAGDQAAAKLGSLDGVASVSPVGTETAEQDPAPAFDPQIPFGVSMIGADVAQSRLGYTGRGIRVAVIDSGIDYDHPDLGGCFGSGCRVDRGYDLVGDDYDAEPSDPGFQPVPHPDPFPDDCYGHGTHVAGIIGANGAIRGVAPDVTFSAYRVIGCSGGVADDVLIAAMERAYRDGADVVNMSIGDALAAWPQAPVSAVASRLVRHGVVVVTAVGNDHLEGLGAAGAPAVGEDVIATASVQNLSQPAPGFAISPDDRPVAYLAGTNSPAIPATGTFELARTGTAATPDDACAPLAAGSLAGKVALIRRGTCPFTDKQANAAAAGAVAVVFYNTPGGLSAPPIVSPTIPAVLIGQPDGELIDARLAQGPVTLRWGATAALPVPAGGLVSDTSSEGLAADLTLKPDIAAPGGVVRSTIPLEKGGYAILSGTSMASPHVAGAAALYLQAHPHTRARDVGPILENSADPVPAPGGSGALDAVVRQGAGVVDVDDAILATAAVTPGKLSLGDDAAPSRTLAVVNHGRQPVTFSVAGADALAVSGRDFVTERATPHPATVSFAQDGRPVTTLTVGPRDRARIEVSIAPDPALDGGSVYGGYLVFQPADGGEPLRVPYAGYKGDYWAAPAMTPTSQGFPWLARATGLAAEPGGSLHPVYARAQDGAVFTLAPRTLSAPAPSTATRGSADAPFVLLHLDQPARRIRVEVFSPQRRRSLGVALSADYIRRNRFDGVLGALQPWTLTTALALDGTVMRGHRRLALPDGDYYVVVTVARAQRPGAAVQTWTSPRFRIARG